ncbi:ACT domain-containing protein [Tateyamaria omphalii]|uniref:ACT domain-containing protein n=1 Tax=Tateyamaria omphalii TaxID=299262 RepID=UPI001C998DCF|nr:ACT domain-containing protein [Tateyamaria omphalii]MBY5934606.1 ACT domain-containing protein [Tateyamaria omphalii]
MPVTDTHAMISGMTPALQPGAWVFCTMPEPVGLADAFALIREAEGMTLILPFDVAQAAGQDVSVVMSLITLEVFSDLEGIGLTAAVSTALAGAGISCNVVAAYHHDHIFVGQADADRAVKVLKALQQDASKS